MIGCLPFVWSFDGSLTRTSWQIRCSGVFCPALSCVDEIQNQGATEVECGGLCPACGLNHTIGTGNCTSCIRNLFDSDALTAYYGNNQNFTETYCSYTLGDCISINFNNFGTEACYEHLAIYDRPTTATPLIGCFNDNTNNPDLISGIRSCITFLMDEYWFRS